jgi:hypothetical protein
MKMPRGGIGLLLSLLGLLALAHMPPADGGCVEPREVEECPMLDYKIYPNQDVDEAEEKIGKVAGEQIAAWKGKVGMEEGRGRKKGKGVKLDFCEDLIRCVLDRRSCLLLMWAGKKNKCIDSEHAACCVESSHLASHGENDASTSLPSQGICLQPAHPAVRGRRHQEIPEALQGIRTGAQARMRVGAQHGRPVVC